MFIIEPKAEKNWLGTGDMWHKAFVSVTRWQYSVRLKVAVGESIISVFISLTNANISQNGQQGRAVLVIDRFVVIPSRIRIPFPRMNFPAYKILLAVPGADTLPASWTAYVWQNATG